MMLAVCRDAGCQHVRHCYLCNRPIAECMGFVLVRTVHFLNPSYPAELPVWEMCGVCDLSEPMPILVMDY